MYPGIDANISPRVDDVHPLRDGFQPLTAVSCAAQMQGNTLAIIDEFTDGIRHQGMCWAVGAVSRRAIHVCPITPATASDPSLGLSDHKILKDIGACGALPAGPLEATGHD